MTLGISIKGRKNKIQNPIGVKDFYKFYKQQKKNKINSRVNEITYRKILNKFNLKVKKLIIDDSERIIFPFGFRVRIKKYRNNYLKTKNPFGSDYYKPIAERVDKKYIIRFSITFLRDLNKAISQHNKDYFP